jgi:hypothetical protein
VCVPSPFAFCLQVVTLVQVSPQLPSPQFCVNVTEPEAEPVHDPSAQFCVQFAPVAHCMPQLPSPHFNVHVALSPQLTVQLSSGAHAKLQVPPASQEQPCDAEQALSSPLVPPVAVVPPSPVGVVPVPVVVLLLQAKMKIDETKAKPKIEFFNVSSDNSYVTRHMNQT